MNKINTKITNQIDKNAETLATVHTHTHTHTSNVLEKINRLNI